MLTASEGIVLHTFPYAESAVIAKIYTRETGQQSFLVNGVRSSRSKNKRAVLTPLTIVEIEAYQKENGGLHKVRSIVPRQFQNNNGPSPAKSAISLFLAEVLYRYVRESEANEELYTFLLEQITQLHRISDAECLNFHLFFLVLLSRHLGFYPNTNEIIEQMPFYFDMKEGVFTNRMPSHPLFMEPGISLVFYRLLHSDADLRITRADRKELLGRLVSYFSLHTSMNTGINSLAILEEVFG